MFPDFKIIIYNGTSKTIYYDQICSYKPEQELQLKNLQKRPSFHILVLEILSCKGSVYFWDGDIKSYIKQGSCRFLESDTTSLE